MNKNVLFHSNFEEKETKYQIYPIPSGIIQVVVIPQNFSFIMSSEDSSMLENIHNIFYDYSSNLIMCYDNENKLTSLANVFLEQDIAEAVEQDGEEILQEIMICYLNGSTFDLTRNNIKLIKYPVSNYLNEKTNPDEDFYDYIGIRRVFNMWIAEIETDYYGIYRCEYYRTAIEAALAYDYYTHKSDPDADTNFSLGKYSDKVLEKLGIKTIDDIEPIPRDKLYI